jgi:hypothetical protein
MAEIMREPQVPNLFPDLLQKSLLTSESSANTMVLIDESLLHFLAYLITKYTKPTFCVSCCTMFKDTVIAPVRVERLSTDNH